MSEDRRGPWWKRHAPALRWGGLGVLAVGLFVAGQVADVPHHVESLRDRIGGLGAWGPLVYGAVFVGATLLAAPGTPFTILSPFLFGEPMALAVMITATTTSSIVAFLLSRYLLKDRIERRLAGSETYERLQRMLDNDHWIVIPFIRIVPFFPYTFNNYALGLSNLSFWRYLMWSELVMVPMNVVLVLGASALYRAVFRGETSWWLIGLSVGAGAVVLVVGMIGKRALSLSGR